MHPPLQSRRPWVIVGAGLAVGVLLVAAAVFVLARRIEPRLRTAIVQGLERRFDSEVTLEAIDVSLWPSPTLAGRGLVLRYQGRTDLPPLISVQRFSGRMGFAGMLTGYVEEVTVDGLEVTIPPRRRQDMPPLGGAGGTDERTGSGSPLIGRLTAGNTRLTVLPRDAGKTPRVFDIHSLELTSVGLDGPADFQARLTIPTPAGFIEAEGYFGPWYTGEPSLTPLGGQFTFKADLGTIKGIAGALDSIGSFGGVLERITASGSTRTPDFRLPTLTGAAVPLETTFDAIIDGTNGDVHLTGVRAMLGGSILETSGAIVRVEGIGGRHITLDVSSDEARIDDVLRLIVDGNRPPLVGAMQFDARLDIAPGPDDIVDKLWVDGRFSLRQAHFQSEAVQAGIDELSRRAQGRPGDETVDDVVSNMEGRFALKSAVLTLPHVSFSVTGAEVQMAGTYGLRSETLAFRGDVRMEATASQMTTGIRSWLLKPFDALLRKHGAGTRVAIKIEGHRDDPEFGIEVGRTLRGR